MSAREIISVRGLSKAYAIYQRPMDMLKEAVTGRKRHDTFWALRGVDFSMLEKERIGIIGANGSGKSTLLKIITGHLPATEGSVRVDGKVSAMLSLNTVLNPEETGIANIRFNLLLNGCPKHEVERKVEEIIEFTELGPFIYAPVKTYSSGMNAKLAFAITTSIDPDILVIDEVLSVGDAYFMGKATQRMRELCDRGNGLLFVSHSISAVQMLCNKVLWMENGGVRMFGDSDVVLRAYEEDYRRQEDEATRSGNARRAQDQAKLALQELESGEYLRLRLVGNNQQGVLTDTHYVASIAVRQGGRERAVPLVLPAQTDAAESLDVLGSEWGRIYEHRGRECRTVAPRTGKRRGGHLLLAGVAGEDVEVRVTSRALLGHESLALEYVDAGAGLWRRAEADPAMANGDWQESVFRFKAPVADAQALAGARDRLRQLDRPAVEVASTILLASGREASVLREHEPFTIVVDLLAHDSVPLVDVGLKFTRSDGVHAFWQSAGLLGQNVRDALGGFQVRFVFDENHFGPGDYSVTAYAANGWDFPANYPYSEMFDRKVACLNFKVVREIAELDKGMVNQRMKVEIGGNWKQ